MLEHMMFNVEQLDVKNYTRRKPKYLFDRHEESTKQLK